MRLAAVRRRLPLVAVALTAAISFPLGVVASHSFSDVPTSHPFHADIAAVKDSGVSSGCGGGKFCPEDFVTRGQMAAFLNRLGALRADKPPVVNADKVDGKDEVLGQGPIITSYLGPWQRSNGGLSSPLNGEPLLGYQSTGDGTNNNWYLPIPAPNSIDGVVYSLSSVRLCISGGPPYINFTQINRITPGLAQGMVADGTDRSSGCYTVAAPANDGTNAAYAILLGVVYPASAGALVVQTIHATWVPAP
jgi:hypothetical protein